MGEVGPRVGVLAQPLPTGLVGGDAVELDQREREIVRSLPKYHTKRSKS